MDVFMWFTRKVLDSILLSIDYILIGFILTKASVNTNFNDEICSWPLLYNFQISVVLCSHSSRGCFWSKPCMRFWELCNNRLLKEAKECWLYLSSIWTQCTWQSSCLIHHTLLALKWPVPFLDENLNFSDFLFSALIRFMESLQTLAILVQNQSCDCGQKIETTQVFQSAAYETEVTERQAQYFLYLQWATYGRSAK